MSDELHSIHRRITKTDLRTKGTQELSFIYMRDVLKIV
jgi:hypothetical protein